ncbi:transcriptional regulator [Aeromonas sp. A5]|uniref:winged helix-turn-helix domain-containing protein n=1 Tax=unclassified Aeromonas TaxID=257493 RepID=UPI00376F8337
MNFNSLILDIDSGDVILDGQKIARLGASETSILALLASNEGALFSKEQLIDEGWPNKVVSPNSLTVAIKNIRKILSAKHVPTYIETVHRKGYIYHCGGVQFSIKDKDTPCSLYNKIPKPYSEESGDYIAKVNTVVNIEPNIELTEKRNLSEYTTADKNTYNKKHVNYKRIFNWTSFIVIYIFSLCLAIFVFLSKKELICYQVEQATVCGRFKLDNATLNDIKIKLTDKTGDYLYGYTKNLDGIEIYSRR